MNWARVSLNYPPLGKRYSRFKNWLRFSVYFTKRFVGVFLLLTLFLSVMLYGVGWVPASVGEFGDRIIGFFIQSDVGIARGGATPTETITASPRIIIPAIALSAPMVFPESTDLDVLNTGLTKGVVHYPGSALPSEQGNVFLFGHSTGLAVVYNKAFEVFNRLHELQPGDVIRVRYGNREYWYRVSSVRIAKAAEALVEFNTTKRMLTLSTCRIFGAKDDRFVVSAEFMQSYPLQFAPPAISS